MTHNPNAKIVGIFAPAEVKTAPAKLLPLGYERWIGTGRFIPVLHLNKTRWALVHELPDLPTWTNRSEIYCNRGSSSDRFLFYYGLYGNDSGNPCFMLLGDERILLYAVHAHRNGVGEHLESIGPHTTLYATELKAAIDSLSDAAGESRRSFSFFEFTQFPALLGGGAP